MGYDWRMANGQHPPLELTIGVVGSHDLVEQIMLSGTAVPAPATGPAGAASGPGGNGQAAGGYSTAPAVARVNISTSMPSAASRLETSTM